MGDGRQSNTVVKKTGPDFRYYVQVLILPLKRAGNIMKRGKQARGTNAGSGSGEKGT